MSGIGRLLQIGCQALLQRVVEDSVSCGIGEVGQDDGVSGFQSLHMARVKEPCCRDEAYGGNSLPDAYKFLPFRFRRHSLRQVHFPRQLRVAHIVRVQVVEMNANAVLYLGFAQIVQRVFPSAELPQHVGDASRCEDVACVAAIHHSLCDVDAFTGYVLIRVDVLYPIDLAAVQPHAQWN